jgi:hypothetical protein
MPQRNGGDGTEQTRAALLDLLLSKVKDDTYPSATTMDLIEELLSPEELPAYAAVLMEKISRENYPSASMMKRLVDLVPR